MLQPGKEHINSRIAKGRVKKEEAGTIGQAGLKCVHNVEPPGDCSAIITAELCHVFPAGDGNHRGEFYTEYLPKRILAGKIHGLAFARSDIQETVMRVFKGEMIEHIVEAVQRNGYIPACPLPLFGRHIKAAVGNTACRIGAMAPVEKPVAGMHAKKPETKSQSPGQAARANLPQVRACSPEPTPEAKAQPLGPAAGQLVGSRLAIVSFLLGMHTRKSIA